VSCPVPHPKSSTVRPGPMSSRSNAVCTTEAVKLGFVAYCSKVTYHIYMCA
jgi:hypothetical protein